MLEQKQKDGWEEIKNIWKNQIRTEEINIQMSKLVAEIKGKMSQWEKDTIKSDIIKIKSSWDQYKGKVSQFEKDSTSKDILKITKLIKKVFQKLRRKD